jgi:hypothetical protein
VDAIALVDEQLKAGRKLLERLQGVGIPVTAAAWVKPTERFQWYLYLVTPLVGEDGRKKPAYRQILPIVQELQGEGAWIDVFDVTPIGLTSATGKAIAETSRQQNPIRVATPLRRPLSGDLSIDGAYVYAPVPAPVTS